MADQDLIAEECAGDLPTISRPLTCAIEAALVRPQLDRLSRDMNAAHSQLREHANSVGQLILWRDDSSRRLALLEASAEEKSQLVADLKLEVGTLVVRVNGEFEALKESLKALSGRVDGEFKSAKERLDHVNSGVETLIVRFDRHSNEMKEAALDTTKQHEKSMRNSMTIAYSIAALVAVLITLHGAITGNPLIDYLQQVYGALFP